VKEFPPCEQWLNSEVSRGDKPAEAVVSHPERPSYWRSDQRNCEPAQLPRFGHPVFRFAEIFSGHYCVSVACCLSLPRRYVIGEKVFQSLPKARFYKIEFQLFVINRVIFLAYLE
jgi:hypothetical protein